MPELTSLALNALALPARLLFPPVCVGCRRQVSQPGALCGQC
jgi:predicted amidophosphoribosyltransferase